MRLIETRVAGIRITAKRNGTSRDFIVDYDNNKVVDVAYGTVDICCYYEGLINDLVRQGFSVTTEPLALEEIEVIQKRYKY